MFTSAVFITVFGCLLLLETTTYKEYIEMGSLTFVECRNYPNLSNVEKDDFISLNISVYNVGDFSIEDKITASDQHSAYTFEVFQQTKNKTNKLLTPLPSQPRKGSYYLDFELMAAEVVGITQYYFTKKAAKKNKEIINGTRNASHPYMFEDDNYSKLLDPNGPEVQFILFTRQYLPFNLKIGDVDGYKRSGFNATHPTKIIIHGFQSDISKDVFVVNKKAYLETGDYNVIGLDWSAWCSFDYSSAVRRMCDVGKILGNFLNWLSELGVDLSDVHLIAHSLGAHIPGIAANYVKDQKIGRITGLDPATPGLRDTENDMKLDSSDANIVDIVHTYVRFLSSPQSIGHIDFYANGARFQPGCPEGYNLWKFADSLICHHSRSYYLFAESIRNKKAFRSTRCESVDDALNERCNQETNVYMGQVESYKAGIYYFQTAAEKPYALTMT